MDASGKDYVLLETVGVGQGEIDVVDHADTIVLALMPGSGDSIQALKAGRDGDPRRDRRSTSATTRSPTRWSARCGPCWRSAPSAPGGCPWSRPRRPKGEGIAEAARDDRRPPRAHRGGGHAGRAPGAQPARRGDRDRRLAHAARAGARAEADPEWAALLERVEARDRPCDGRAQAAGESRLPDDERRVPSNEPQRRRGQGLEGPPPRRDRRLPASARSRGPTSMRVGAARRSGCSCAWAASGTTALVPARDAVEAVGHVWVPYAVEQIRGAPKVDPKRPVSREYELALPRALRRRRRRRAGRRDRDRDEGSATASPLTSSLGGVGPVERRPSAASRGSAMTRSRRPNSSRTTFTSDHSSSGANASVSCSASREGFRRRRAEAGSSGAAIETPSLGGRTHKHSRRCGRTESPVQRLSRRHANAASWGNDRSTAAQQPSWRAITICWTSSVPSPIVRILASR